MSALIIAGQVAAGGWRAGSGVRGENGRSGLTNGARKRRRIRRTTTSDWEGLFWGFGGGGRQRELRLTTGGLLQSNMLLLYCQNAVWRQ